jgi:hypothetical protein
MAHDMCTASNEINKKHLEFQLEEFLASGATEYATDSVTYKKGTTILEESQQLEFAERLALAGVRVTIQESPPVVALLKKRYGDLFNYE